MQKLPPYTFIFDLDNTLVNTDALKIGINCNINPYNTIKKDIELQELLSKIKNKKIIFSNAMDCHINSVLYALGIQDYISNIIDRNITKTLKPNLNSYITTLENIDITDINRCIFFDDLVQNLITAKYIGWVTIHISSEKSNHPCIDYSFSTIHDALRYFINKNKN